MKRTVVTSVLLIVALWSFMPARAQTAGALPNFSHVYTILMENEEASAIIGSANAPYINSLAQQYALGTAYTAVTHPSLPNYMSLTGGDTFFTDDCIGCTVSATNVADQIEGTGRRWKAYMEDMPAPCTTDDSGPGNYTVHHNPFVHFIDVVTNPSRCSANVVPFTDFSRDLAAGTLPDYVWITPNLCHDMHDCSVATGDAWLKTVIPSILQRPDFNTSVLFLVWDEGTSNTGGGGVIPMLVISPLVKPGFRSAVAENHYSLLRTIQDAWGLAPLAHTAAATAMTEYFSQAVVAPGVPTNLVASSVGTSLTLSWRAPTTGGIPTSYVIDLGSATGLTNIGSASTGNALTTLTTTGLATGRYYVRVHASNSVGASAPSNEAVLIVGALAPGAPSGLVGSVVGSATTLTWQAPATGGIPTAYVLEAGSAPGLSNLGSASTGNAATTLTTTGLATGQYFIRVRASNASGVSADSNEAALVVGAMAPGAPTGLVGSTTGTSLTLTWHAPTTGGAPTSYTVEAGTAPGLANLGSASTGGVATTLSASGVAAGTYYFRVRAQDAAGLSTPSNEILLSVGQVASRDVLKRPFSSGSIWNMPIGSHAVYQPTGLAAASSLFGDVDYFFVLSASDPLTTMFNDEGVWSGPRCSSTRSAGISLNIPATLVVPDASGSNTPNNAAAFLLPNAHTLEQVNALARCAGGGPVYGVPSEQNGGAVEDLYGTGLTGGHAGSNLSSIGGTIRLGELLGTQPIPHALKIEVDGRYLFYGTQGPGFRWPANVTDTCAPSCYTGATTSMVQGSLLAVPPAATEQSLGLTTVPGKKLLHALQDYGGYVVDNSDDPSFNLAVENGVKAEFKSTYGFDFDTGGVSAWMSDVQAIFGSLRVVTNNAPTSVGGGGTPRVALAPFVSGPTVPGITATLSAAPSAISAGQPATITWSVSTGIVVIDQGLGSVGLTGSATVRPTATTTYTLSAGNSTGALTKTATVVVQ